MPKYKISTNRTFRVLQMISWKNKIITLLVK